MRRITIVIPTYWCRRRGHAGLPEDAIFDHPTAIDESGTLGRCLQSIEALQTHAFRVLVITAAVSPEIAPQAESTVERLIEPFRRSYPVCQFSYSDISGVRRVLEGKRLDPRLVGLDSYARIRNCQILGSVLLDSDLIVAVDDDETVPPEYLERALASFDELERRGKPDAGVAGIYLDAAGEYRLKVRPEEAASSNKFVHKALLINRQFEACIGAGERLTETPVALGGNMVFAPQLFRNVSFDPGITRGEDIDYLMNSRLFGYSWFLDARLTITHLPPEVLPGQPLTTTPYARLQRDVTRFLYQRQKIRISRQRPDLHSLAAEDFGIYPGQLLCDDLDEQALEALRVLRPPDADERFFPPPERILDLGRRQAQRAGEYPAFNQEWRRVLEVVEGEQELKERMRRKLGD